MSVEDFSLDGAEDASPEGDQRAVMRPVRSHPLAVPSSASAPGRASTVGSGVSDLAGRDPAEGTTPPDDPAVTQPDGSVDVVSAVRTGVAKRATSTWTEATPTPVAPPTPSPTPTASAVPTPAAPTLADLLSTRAQSRPLPAQWGWRHLVGRVSGRRIALAPGGAEQAYREALAAIRRPLHESRTVVVVNPKGGAHKTTASLMLAATLGEHRGGSVLAWDNNETRGTLGWRAQPGDHSRTAMDLLRALPAMTDGRSLRVGDLDGYVRAQGWGHFDVLASDEDAASAALVDAGAFDRLHHALAGTYRVVVVDTGNNMRASNWQAAVAAADQLVIVSTVREDTAQSAAWLADGLRAAGQERLVAEAVTVLTAPGRSGDRDLAGRVEDHFARLTRAVVHVPHDASLVSGGPVDPVALSAATRRAWERAAAVVVQGL